MGRGGQQRFGEGAPAGWRAIYKEGKEFLLDWKIYVDKVFGFMIQNEY